MDEEIFKLKLACLFHDPTIKPLVWKVKGEGGHEEVAYEIITNLNSKLPAKLRINESIVNINDKKKLVLHYAIEHADWVASASDRLIVTELYKGLIKDIYSVNILDMNTVSLDEYLTKYYTYDKLLHNYKSTFVNNLLKYIEPSKLEDKPHILYHIMWRFLIDATVESLYNIKEASLLPADTRVPYYTIFDHLYTASGFIPTLKDDSTVGKIGIIHWESIGVQSFIQESRAFRDLWASSFLVSLMNTAVIIRLAKEYGFDSILSPNILYNPLVDLYLYAHTENSRLKVKLDDLKVPTTPDKGFAIVPYDMVEEYTNLIPKWFNEIWKSIVNVVKEYVKERLNERYKDIYKDSLNEWLSYLFTFEDIKEKSDISQELKNYLSKNYGSVLSNPQIRKDDNRLLIEEGSISILVDLTADQSSAVIKSGNKEEELIIKNCSDKHEIYYNISEREIIDKYIEPYKSWNEFWDSYSSIPINFVCVGEKFLLDEDHIIDKLNKWDIYYPDYYYEHKIVDEIKKLRKVAESIGYNPKFQFFEFPIVMEVLKAKRKLVAESPRQAVAEWVLTSNIHIKDRKLICTVCYKRPAVIFPTSYVREKLPMIKESERLCPICLTKRLLATVEFFEDILANVYHYSDNSINYNGYKSAICKIRSDYEDKFNNYIPDINPLLVPSLDTISTLTYRSSWVRYLSKEDSKNNIPRFIELLMNFISNAERLYQDAPDIEWFEDLSDLVLLCIGGEFLLVEELKKSYKGVNEEVFNNLKNILDDISKDLERQAPLEGSILSTKPSKYAAIIRADGDNMGKLFTLSELFSRKFKDVLPPKLQHYLKDDSCRFGNYLSVAELKDIQYRVTPSFYAFVSRALAIIAKKIAEMAKNYATVIVYAGGDDILALSPAELSLIFASKARELFSEELLELSTTNSKKNDTKILVTGLGKKATQSFAIRYFHIFSPLSKELKESNEDLDNKAKEVECKNGLVIVYNARSGNIIRSILKWEYDYITEKIFNITSLTLKYKRIAERGFVGFKNIDNLNTRLSDTAFRDIIKVTNKDYSKDILNVIAENELKRHSKDLLEELMSIINGLDKEVTINGEKYPVVLEFIKAALAFHNALDSKPLALGARL